MKSYGWEAISAVRRDRMLDAEDAVEAVTTAARESFYGWLRIGAGLYDIQQAVMELSGANRPYGRAYNAAYEVIRDRVPKLAEIDPATRSHAIWLHEHRDAVEMWHAGLDDDVKRQTNHPRTCRRHYEDDQQKAGDGGPGGGGNRAPVLADMASMTPAERGQELAELSDDEREALLKLLPDAERAEWQVEYAAAVSTQAQDEQEMVAAAQARGAEVHPRNPSETQRRVAHSDAAEDTVPDTAHSRDPARAAAFDQSDELAATQNLDDPFDGVIVKRKVTANGRKLFSLTPLDLDPIVEELVDEIGIDDAIEYVASLGDVIESRLGPLIVAMLEMFGDGKPHDPAVMAREIGYDEADIRRALTWIKRRDEPEAEEAEPEEAEDEPEEAEDEPEEEPGPPTWRGTEEFRYTGRD